MSKQDPNNLHHYHNKGQEDYAKGDYDPPNDTIIHFFDTREYEQDQRDAYRAGWENAKDQDK